MADENILTMCLVFLAAGAFSGAVSAIAARMLRCSCSWITSQPVRCGRPVPDRLLRVRLHGHLGGYHLRPGPFAVSMSKATGLSWCCASPR